MRGLVSKRKVDGTSVMTPTVDLWLLHIYVHTCIGIHTNPLHFNKETDIQSWNF